MASPAIPREERSQRQTRGPGGSSSPIRPDHVCGMERAAGSRRDRQGRVRGGDPKGVAIVDVTTWGWATVIWGALLVVAGLGCSPGPAWAALARHRQAWPSMRSARWRHGELPQGISARNILIVALNILVLYALTAHWRGFKDSLVLTGLRRRSRDAARSGPSIHGSP